MSLATTIIVAIAALLAVALMICWPQLRQRLLGGQRLSASHRRTLLRRLPWRTTLTDRQRDQLLDHAGRLLADVPLIGAQGMTISERQQLTIAGQAALLGLGAQPLDAELPSEIALYPGDIDTVVEASTVCGLVEDLADMAIGPHPGGSRIALSWPAVKAASAGSPRNPVVRAFVHLQTFGDPLGDAGLTQAADSWATALAEQQGAVSDNGSTPIGLPTDASPERFFALAAEAFFQQPQALQQTDPALYDLLAGYFDLDTARRPPAFRPDRAR